VLYYGHWSKEQGRAEARGEAVAEMAREVERFHEADKRAVEGAASRARNAEALAGQRAKELQDVRDLAKELADADGVCVPGSIADRLRDLS
jgi:hypothetical protein